MNKTNNKNKMFLRIYIVLSKQSLVFLAVKKYALYHAIHFDSR